MMNCFNRFKISTYCLFHNNPMFKNVSSLSSIWMGGTKYIDISSFTYTFPTLPHGVSTSKPPISANLTKLFRMFISNKRNRVCLSNLSSMFFGKFSSFRPRDMTFFISHRVILSFLRKLSQLKSAGVMI